MSLVERFCMPRNLTGRKADGQDLPGASGGVRDGDWSSAENFWPRSLHFVATFL